MKHVPCCPACGWTLEFVPDTTYPEYDEWTGRCWNHGCEKYRRVWRPSDLGWTEEKTMELRP